MKTNTVHVLLLAAFAVLLTGCAGDELTDASGGGGTSPAGAFTITVADRGGYASASGGAHTRATENDYTTTFTAGDRIGVFAVRNGELMPEVNNLCLTAAAGEGSSIVWKDTDGNDLLRYMGATYYAYYPYRENLTGELVPTTATDAQEFFKNVISSWTPSTNQGTYANYTAQDLMVAQDTPSGKTLTFSMSHCMALVVIDLPRTKYKFSNQNPSIPDYIIDAPDTRFGDFTPYRMADGTYRYLVNPATAGTSLSGSYTGASSAKMEWQIVANTLSTITPGNYKLFKVDKNVNRETKTHTLQVGDFFMKDGSLLAGSTDLLSDAQKADCIGIVYSTDADRIGEAAKKALAEKGVAEPHGLVMALTNASEDCRWGEYNKDENLKGKTGEPFFKNTNNVKKMYINVDGYGESQWIINTYNETILKDTYTAFYYASLYGKEGESTKYATPRYTTGWFIPSMGQWWDILSNMGDVKLENYKNSVDDSQLIPKVTQTVVENINKHLKKTGSASLILMNTYFLSSSEYTKYYACGVGFNKQDYTLSLHYYDKSYSIFKVRCSFAF